MNKWILAVALTLIAFSFLAVAQQPMTMGMMQNCPMAGMMGSADVKYEATPAGASLVFTSKDPARVTELQTMLRQMAERMNKGEGPHDGHHPAK